MTPEEQFRAECASEIEAMARDRELATATRRWMDLVNAAKYSYHFTSLGRPIIQYPQDIVAAQELIWQIQPDLVIETGIAHGGSLINSAAALAMIDYCAAAQLGQTIAPGQSRRQVLGIDIDIRSHNRRAIEAHPLAGLITMIEGSSTAPEVVRHAARIAGGHERVLVFLDSNHTHDHVLAELMAYGPMTSIGSYCVVYDTVIADMPADAFPDRPWTKTHNPRSAVAAFLARQSGTDGPRFEVDTALEAKLLVTVAPGGYLRRVA